MRYYATTIKVLVAVNDDRDHSDCFEIMSALLSDFGVGKDGTGVVDWGYDYIPPAPMQDDSGYWAERDASEIDGNDEGAFFSGAFPGKGMVPA